MYSITVRDHILIAHSLAGDMFGPAQNVHGATYIVDAEFSRSHLDKNSVVIDIGLASKILKDACSELNYSNLDEKMVFRGEKTTGEFLARHIHNRICEKVKSIFKGSLKISMRESHVAGASYKGEVS